MNAGTRTNLVTKTKISVLLGGLLLATCGIVLAPPVPTASNPLETGETVPQIEAAQKAAAAQAEQAAAYARYKASFVPRDPWRVFNGETNYVKFSGVEFCGKVVDITKGGVRIEGQYGPLFGTSYLPDSDYNIDFFVANFPFEVVNDQVISPGNHLMAFVDGTYTYTTVNNGSRTIHKLDYGEAWLPPPPTPAEIAAAKAKQELAQKAQADKLYQAEVRTVHWLQSRATNGDVDAQCDLGEHYLNGVGCQTNRELAIYWLKKSADQGDLEASNKLATLNP